MTITEDFQKLIAGAFQEGFFAAKDCGIRGKALSNENMEKLLRIYLQKIDNALELRMKEVEE